MKVSVPKGTRDFPPTEMVKRNFIFKTIRDVFEKYGYQPIETPAMENLSTLEGKYGEEGDKLLFRILNSGIATPTPQEGDLYVLKSSLKGNAASPPSGGWGAFTEKGLRYDLTVPFARYVAQHRNEITFPFKRYQIQPVWRADKPQKGRYREFYQCDADVIGSDSLLNEVELVQMIDEVMKKLQVTSYKLLVNNRKILAGISEVIGEKEKIIDITIAIDKFDKIGTDSVNEELKEKRVSDNAIKQLQPLIAFKGNTQEKITFLKNLLTQSETGMKGIAEIEFIFSCLSNLQPATCNLELNLMLARGLNYYTGAIFEVKANDVQIGSICGGGRYDDLTGIFGLPNVSGVGISFGIDRIFDVMNELNLFDSMGMTASTTKVMLAHFGDVERKYCIGIALQLRSSGINTEIYPDITKKISKQFDYADKKQIPFVIVVGGDEMKTGELTLKEMSSGEQTKMKVTQIIQKLQS